MVKWLAVVEPVAPGRRLRCSAPQSVWVHCAHPRRNAPRARPPLTRNSSVLRPATREHRRRGRGGGACVLSFFHLPFIFHNEVNYQVQANARAEYRNYLQLSRIDSVSDDCTHSCAAFDYTFCSSPSAMPGSGWVSLKCNANTRLITRRF